MRNVTIALSALSLVFLLSGCEDGPKQTYEPTRPGAAFNDGTTPPAVDSAAKQGFAPPDGGASTVTNAEIICSTPVKKEKIAAALRQPIIPPRFACGIDVAGDNNWQGITIEQVEKGYKRVDFLVDGRYPKPIDVKSALANTTLASAASLYKGNTDDPKDLTQLCQGDNLGDFLGSSGSENTAGWGDNQECFANYSVRTHKILSVWQQPGYLGAMTCYSRPNSRFEQDGAHVYTVPMNSRVLKDGMPLDFSSNWMDTTNPNSFLNELYDACLFTFASFITPEDGVVADSTGSFGALTSAAADGHMVLGSFTDGSHYWYVPAIGFGWLVASITAGPEVATTPSNFQLYSTKTLGFSTADINFKFDAEGPVGYKQTIGVSPVPCKITIGMTYGDFINTCVAVTGDDTKNKTEIAKLLGNKTNARERFFLDVQGIDVNFSEVSLPQFDIIHDGDAPSDDDIATAISWDQSALGKIANDYAGNDPSSGAQDYHGGGLVWLEFARLAQAEIQKLRTDVCADPKKCMPGQVPLRTLGDPACLGDNVKPNGTGGFIYPQGCTGLEGFVTTAPPLDVLPDSEPYLNNVALGVGAAGLSGGALKVGLKPGQPRIVVCNKLDGKTGTQCTVNTGGFTGALFGGSYSRVLSVFGKGDVANMPNDIKDGRFFFKQWFKAMVKYFIASGGGTENGTAVHNAKLDVDALFFDGSGQFETAEYIDRRFVEQTGVPMDVSVVADTKNGILNDYNFSRETYRGEELVYDAMLDRSTPGSVFEGKGDDVLLSNVFGSPVLSRVWGALPQCATAGGTACVKAKFPSDPTGKIVNGDDGKPLLAPYAGAIASTSPFVLGYHTVSCTKSTKGVCNAGVNCCPIDPVTGVEVAVTSQIGTELLIEPTDFPQLSAKVTYPVRHDPYDNTSYFAPVDLGPNPAKSDGSHLYKMAPQYDDVNSTNASLIPYYKKQPGIGFPIAITGTLNKFITTAQIDLSGTTVSFNIDIDEDPTPDPLTKKPVPGASVIKAVETVDFLGLVFLCRDADTAEVLSVRMYDTVASILDWINHHPTAANACDFIIRYSPYNNFPDFVTSRQNGVTLGISQGGGFGRVNDVTLWDPNTPY